MNKTDKAAVMGEGNAPRGFDPIPSHFFTNGPYEVWALSQGFPTQMRCIATGLSLETARSYQWIGKEIRLDGKVVK